MTNEGWKKEKSCGYVQLMECYIILDDDDDGFDSLTVRFMSGGWLFLSLCLMDLFVLVFFLYYFRIYAFTYFWVDFFCPNIQVTPFLFTSGADIYVKKIDKKKGKSKK